MGFLHDGGPGAEGGEGVCSLAQIGETENESRIGNRLGGGEKQRQPPLV